MKTDALALQKASNVLWGTAKKSQLFLRKPKFVGVGKNRKRATQIGPNGVEMPVPQRGNRCLRSKTIKLMLSGAAAEVAALLSSEAEVRKTEIAGEARVAAALPKLSQGAEIALEHALSTYTQTVFDAAKRIKDSMKLHGKVSAGCMSAAADIVNAAVFSSSTLAPGAFVAVKRVSKKTKKKATKEEASKEASNEAHKEALESNATPA